VKVAEIVGVHINTFVIGLAKLSLSGPPECRREDHDQSKQFQATEQHRQCTNPGLEIC
jgi:hypothetical protein